MKIFDEKIPFESWVFVFVMSGLVLWWINEGQKREPTPQIERVIQLEHTYVFLGTGTVVQFQPGDSGGVIELTNQAGIIEHVRFFLADDPVFLVDDPAHFGVGKKIEVEEILDHNGKTIGHAFKPVLAEHK